MPTPVPSASPTAAATPTHPPYAPCETEGVVCPRPFARFVKPYESDSRDSTDRVGAGQDQNGDGFGDFFITSADFDVPGGNCVYVVNGPVAGEVPLDEADARLTFQGGGYPFFAGDLNADGNADLLVRVPSAATTGAAYVLYGPMRGVIPLEEEADVTLAQSLDRGDVYRAAPAGDVNGDGYDDIIASFGPSGTVGIYYGPLPLGHHTLDDADVRLVSEVDQGLFGSAVAGAGDVDDDGYEDVLVSAPEEGSLDRGAVYLFKGPLSGVVDATAADAKLIGLNGLYTCQVVPPGIPACGVIPSRTGEQIGSVGDVNGDGYSDLLISAPDRRTGGVWYLQLGPVAGEVSLEEEATLIGTTFSFPHPGAIDVNGDDNDDVALGSQFFDPSEQDRGFLTFIFGPPTQRKYNGFSEGDLTVLSAIVGDRIGSYNSSAGDVDGDGLTDVLVSSAPLDGAYPAHAFLYLGADLMGGITVP